MTELKIEYRGYVFVNTALSSIQKGVQGAHAIAEVGHVADVSLELAKINNPLGDRNLAVIHNLWRGVHRTLIFLDGGFHGVLNENYKTFSSLCKKLSLPHAKFIEDEETMNCMTTAFAGIIPSTIYDMELPDDPHELYSPWSDAQLAMFLSGFKLAV